MTKTKHRIMIVDDDADMRSLLSMSLSEDFESFDANNGLDAILKLGRYEPDLAIVDIMMPLMDGKELMRKIRATPGCESIPLLALSALNSRDDIRQGYDAGANLYLTKPFDAERLLRNVRMSLEGRTPRAKKMTIEEVEERERRYADQMKRALEKKAHAAHEEERPSTAEPAPARTSASSGLQRKLDAMPRVEGITAPRKESSTPPKEKPNDSRQTTAVDDEERSDPFSVERSGVPPRRRGSRPAPVSFTEKRDLPKAAPAPRAAGAVVPRILIVDDDDDYLLVMRTTLEEHYEVVTAHDGFEAMSRMAECEPDLFVIDAMMPRMSGYQLMEMIKGSLDTYFKPIILATAKGSPRDLKMAQEKGANKCLIKPFPPEQMLKAVKDLASEPSFHPQIKSHSIQEIMLEDGRRRAAHMSVDQRKKLWESYGTIEKFLKETK